jgi:ATP/maltotriose-dependent transcriptional regulator MalT
VAMTVDGALRLGADDLVLRFEETETLIQRAIVADDELARVITRDCARWPAAIALSIAAQARRHSVLAAPLRLDTLIGGLLETDDRLSPRTLALLGHLSLVSDAIGNAIGMPNLVDAIVASGLPIRMTGSWGRLPDPVREHLATTGRLTDQDLVTALEVVFASGETTMAVDMLLAANRPTDVCRLIAEIPYRQLDRLDVDEMAALLNAVPAVAVIQNPRWLAQLARAAEGRVRIGLRTRLLARLAEIVRVLDDPVMTRELEAELICDLDRDSLIDEADVRGRAFAREHACARTDHPSPMSARARSDQ